MNILPAHTIVNISSEEKIICHLPKSKVNIELRPTRIEKGHWQIALKIIDLSQQNIKEMQQVIDCKDCNRYHIGYYKDQMEAQRYHVINLVPYLKEEEYGFQKDTALIWFQVAKNGLEVQSEINCKIEENSLPA